MTVLTYSGALVVVRCWCGIRHAIPDELDREQRRVASLAVYCPVGHTYVTSGKSTEQKLSEAEARLTHERDQHAAEVRHLEAQRSAAKGQVTKMRKRIEAGVCIHCHRTFKDLARHMESKHAAGV